MVKQLINKMKNKLCCSQGETLGEVLVALLVAALAITMLAGAIGVSTRLVQHSKEVMDDYYRSNSNISDGSGTVSEGTISFGATKLIDNHYDIPVKFFTNETFETDKVVAYQKKVP